MSIQQKHPIIIFAEQSIQTMRQEAKKARPEEETGGILVGRRLDHRRILVIAATGPGPNAVHHHYMFSPDVEFANQELERLRQVYPGTDLIGLWHKHPPNLERPSHGDEQQVAEIFNDPDYAHLTELVTPIVLIRNGQFLLKPYYINRSLVVSQHYFQAIERRIELNEEAEQLLRTRPAQTNTGFTTPEIQNRLRDERQTLSRHFQVQIKEQNDEIYLTARSKRNGQVTVYFVLPTEFPRKPPTARLEYNGQEWLGAKSISLANWTPESSLAQVADELVSRLPVSKIPLPIRQALVSPQPNLLENLGIGFIATVGGLIFLFLALLTMGGYLILTGLQQTAAASDISGADTTVDVSSGNNSEVTPQPTTTIVNSELAIIETIENTSSSNNSELSPQPSSTTAQIPDQTSPVAKPTNPPTSTATFMPTPTLTRTTSSTDTMVGKLKIITTIELHKRLGPGLNYESLGIFDKGVELEVIGKNKEMTWFKVRDQYKDDLEVWVYREHTTIAEGSPEQILTLEAPPTPTPTLTPIPTKKPTE
ncbi:MAG: Mov34/MPN/PAD-1 family protein [Anaerolineae bacterium]|nr:Mov34/MPN/PAD-1 family protein [Anaerolineae bacterium]